VAFVTAVWPVAETAAVLEPETVERV